MSVDYAYADSSSLSKWVVTLCDGVIGYSIILYTRILGSRGNTVVK